jgi:hypothetical protein
MFYHHNFIFHIIVSCTHSSTYTINCDLAKKSFQNKRQKKKLQRKEEIPKIVENRQQQAKFLKIIIIKNYCYFIINGGWAPMVPTLFTTKKIFI